jgi:hypothetical protein
MKRKVNFTYITFKLESDFKDHIMLISGGLGGVFCMQYFMYLIPSFPSPLAAEEYGLYFNQRITH